MLNIAINKKNHITSCRSLLAKIFTAFSKTLIALALVLLFTNNSYASGDVINGEKLSQTCLGCHGAPGLRNPGPVYLIPMLGGQNEAYIVSALKAYKDKTRIHATMQAQAASLSDQDMADIAAFFSSSDGQSRKSNVNKSLANTGKKLAASCAACHGADGAATVDNNTPILAGQYESYILHALKEYRSGDRQNPIMSGMVQSLGIEQLEALAAWFAGQDAQGVNAPQTNIFKFN